jgi:predicted DsbA family dithiol-disulfide isomerase
MTRQVRVWLDPSCPWAWQTARWLLDIRDQGWVDLTYELFSLEVNASQPDLPFKEAAPRFGEALASLVLAQREAGDEGFERLYVALGKALHEQKAVMSRDLLRKAGANAGLEELPDRAMADPALGNEVIRRFRDARAHDVFGVPTLAIDEDKVVYGPIIAQAPTGANGLALWRSVEALADRDAFFELKRWPRDVRPGTALRR